MNKLNWQFSRNQRKHFVDNGEFYGKNFRRLWEIIDCRPYSMIHKPEHGYDLFHKGKKVGHAKSVKELKQKAERGIRHRVNYVDVIRIEW